jgi:hypothetical protein
VLLQNHFLFLIDLLTVSSIFQNLFQIPPKG